jgi:hypothetical protein
MVDAGMRAPSGHNESGGTGLNVRTATMRRGHRARKERGTTCTRCVTNRRAQRASARETHIRVPCAPVTRYARAAPPPGATGAAAAERSVRAG